MNQYEILTKAVTIAENNGFVVSKDWQNAIPRAFNNLDFYKIIYQQDFAKALWPDIPIATVNGQTVDKTVFSSWQMHLRDMVIAEDPIAYLHDTLEDINKEIKK